MDIKAYYNYINCMEKTRLPIGRMLKQTIYCLFIGVLKIFLLTVKCNLITRLKNYF